MDSEISFLATIDDLVFKFNCPLLKLTGMCIRCIKTLIIFSEWNLKVCLYNRYKMKYLGDDSYKWIVL